MFAIPGILALILLTYLRPQIYIPQLEGVPLLHLSCAATALGFFVDLRLRYARLQRPPILVPAALFITWCVVTTVIKQPGATTDVLRELFIVVMLFICITFAVQSWKGIRTVARCLCVMAIALSVISIHQRFAPTGCVQFKGSVVGEFDGRSCETVVDCNLDKEPGTNYACEHIGFGTSYALNDRVRWIGILQDPNELAMSISVVVPLLIALYLIAPTQRRRIMLGVGIALALLAVIFTGSRGGQLVFLVTMGVYFIRRYGIRGAMIGVVLAAPVILLGGRHSAEADESTNERIEVLYQAVTLALEHPIIGVGYRQFSEYSLNSLTAHNSYALSAAELGMPGLFLFATILYLCGKTAWLVIRRYNPDGPAHVAVVWAGALLAAQAGFMTGILLLSFNLHAVLWIFFAFNSAFYFAVKRHDPLFEVKFGVIDAARVGAFCIGITSFMWMYTRWKMRGH